MSLERISEFQHATLGKEISGLLLTPATPKNKQLEAGLTTLFSSEVQNGNFKPGSPYIGDLSVPVSTWLEYLSSPETSSIVHAIEIQEESKGPFITVGHVTAAIPMHETDPVETRIYIHDKKNRGRGIGSCAVETHFSGLISFGFRRLVAFVNSLNSGSHLIHARIYGPGHRGYPGKEYSMRAYEYPIKE